MRKHLAIIALLSLATPPVFAETIDAPSLPVDSRIKVLLYDESDVYTLVTKYGYQTNLVFDDGEEVQTISMGDRSLWQIIPAGSRLFIRPMDDGLVTNMTVITNRRSYQFDLKSLDAGSAEKPLYVAKFMYLENNKARKARHAGLDNIPAKHDEPKGPPSPMPPPPPPPPVDNEVPPPPPPPAQQVAPQPVKLEAPEASMNYNYTFTGPDALAPAQVFDDGKSTYIKYRGASDPSLKISAIDKSGSESPAVYFTKDDQIVIDGVYATLKVVRTAGTITIYNETINSK